MQIPEKSLGVDVVFALMRMVIMLNVNPLPGLPVLTVVEVVDGGV